jgi:hypothetical protein
VLTNGLRRGHTIFIVANTTTVGHRATGCLSLKHAQGSFLLAWLAEPVSRKLSFRIGGRLLDPMKP